MTEVLSQHVLNNIFSFLGRKGLLRCQLVNHEWRTEALHHLSLWSLFSFSAACESDNNELTEERVNTADTIEYHKFIIGECDYNYNFDSNGFYDINGNLVIPKNLSRLNARIMYHSQFGKVQTIMKDIKQSYLHPRVLRVDLRKIKSKTDGTYIYIYALEVNIKELEITLQRGYPVMPSCIPVLKRAVYLNYKTMKRKIKDYTPKEVHIPKKKVVPQKQPMGLVPALYKYQLDAVNWMKSIEDDIHHEYEYSYLIPWRVGKSEVYFDRYSKGCFDSRQAGLRTKKITTVRGGILADEILANPGNITEVEEFKNKIMAKIMPSEFNIPTNATLVFVPSHLLKQWHDEIEKSVKYPMNIVVLSNIRDIRGHSVGEIMDADIVLVSHQMLKNKNYKGDSYINMQACQNADWSLQGIALCNFNWRRIVIDEGHEIITDNFYLKEFNLHTAKFWWYVTGTPFPTKESRVNLISLLGMPSFHFPSKRRYKSSPRKKHNSEDLVKQWAFMEIYMNNLYWRNTKESVKNEYEIPEVVEDVKLLHFTPIEKILYLDCDYNHTDLTGEACNSASICSVYSKYTGDRPTLSVVRSALITLIEERIVKQKNEINKLEERIVKYENKAQEMVDSTIPNLIAKRDELIATISANKTQEEKELIELQQSEAQYKVDQAVEKEDTLREKILQSKERIITLHTNIKDGTARLEQVKELDASLYNGPDMSSASFIPVPSLEHIAEKEDTTEEVLQEAKKIEDPLSSWSMVLDLGVAQLRAELKKRGVKPDSKLKKKTDLQRALKEAVAEVNTNIAKGEVPEFLNIAEQTSDKDSKESKKRKQDFAEEPTSKKPRKGIKKQDSSNEIIDAKAKKKQIHQDKINEQNLIQWLVEKEGTKMANLIVYLKHLWEDSPSAKIIIFSQFPKLLYLISSVLEEKDIDYSLMEGNSVKRNKRLQEFKAKESTRHVLLLNINQAASGTNIIEASHIILMEPILTSDAKAIETQAIGRAHRQGQQSQVTVVRFIVKDTIEYQKYIENYD